MDGRFPFYYSAAGFPMNIQQVPYYQQPLPGPSGILAANQGLPNSPAASSDRSGSPSSLEVEDEESAVLGTAVQKKQYDTWTKEEQKTLVNCTCGLNDTNGSKVKMHVKCGMRSSKRLIANLPPSALATSVRRK